MFKINTSQEVIADNTGGGGKFIGSSGIYDVTINFASVAVSAAGSEQFAFNLDYNGNDQTIYGPYYKGKNKPDGSEGDYLEIGTKLYTTLGVVAGLDDGDEFTTEPEKHEVGKDNKEVEFDVIQELTGLDIKLQVQMEYSVYKDAIQERPVIRAFFRADGASAEEIVNDGEIGKRLATVEEKYAHKDSFRDGLTEEDVAAWIEGGRGKGGSKATPAPKTKSASAKTGSMFGKKK